MERSAPSGRVTANAEPTPRPPYRGPTTPAHCSTKTDLVSSTPWERGFTHAVGKAQDKDFWGVDSDIKSLAEMITIYVSRRSLDSPNF